MARALRLQPSVNKTKDTGQQERRQTGHSPGYLYPNLYIKKREVLSFTLQDRRSIGAEGAKGRRDLAYTLKQMMCLYPKLSTLAILQGKGEDPK